MKNSDHDICEYCIQGYCKVCNTLLEICECCNEEYCPKCDDEDEGDYSLPPLPELVGSK